jgi:NADPH-dependent curcumin reductase CurA
MMSRQNRQWTIAARPNGRALKESDFALHTGEVPPLKEGEVLVKVLYLSCDPAQKGWMENIGGYMAPTNIGDVMRAGGVGEVVESRSPALKAGDKVMGQLCWQDYATLPARELEKVEDTGHLSAALGPLGSTGLTAYFGLSKLGKPFPGDTMVITGAAGATGSIAGQIAKIGGCRVVGIAGGAEKCKWLTGELGFDAAIDYKAGGDIREQIHKHAPHGIDVVWDNVGGKMLDDMLAEIALHARVVICGGISRYETGTNMPAGPQNYFNLIFKRATMHGLLLTEYVSEFSAARARLRQWIESGKIKYREDVQPGLEHAPKTLMRVFTGANMGKQLIKVA